LGVWLEVLWYTLALGDIALKTLTPILLLAALCVLSCRYENVWRNGLPHSLVVEGCARDPEPVSPRKMALTTLAVMQKKKIPIHGVNTAHRIIYTDYAKVQGLVVGFTVYIAENGEATIENSEGSPEHTGRNLARVEKITKSVARQMERHACLPLEKLEPLAERSGVYLPPGWPQVSEQ